MSNIEQVLAEVGEAAEQYDNSQPLPEHVEVSRPGHKRSKMFSVRLSEDEMAELEQVAEQANLPARTLVRAWILDRLRGDQPASNDGGLMQRVERLERTVFAEQAAS